ncbi:hypothetical protein [Thermoactinospora rubra]|uniref:hypothetical protein n=1 Tax=Thermoactinospora rubra TaxID=1088767 RepID=UPI000A0F83EB|nr:hypothetical protein [Thermoactinospora rubra]
MAAGTALAATQCQSDSPVELLEAPSTVATVCDENADTRASANYWGKTPAPADSHALRSAETLAKRVGLPGMAKTSAVLSVADMGGVAAGAGAPAVPGKVTAPARPVARMADYPDVPGLPNAPTQAVPNSVRQLPQLPRMGSTVERVQVSKPRIKGGPKAKRIKRQVTGELPSLRNLTGPVGLPSLAGVSIG